MALFKVLRGGRENLPAPTINTDGHAYFCWNDGTFWINYKESDSATEVKQKQVNKDDWTADIAEAIAALETELKSLIAGGVDYLGGVASFAGLANFSTANAGDFCRVTTEFTFGTETAHVGDMLIAIQDKPTNNILHWDLIHNEYDWTHTHSVVAAGTVSKPTFTGTAGTATATYTPAGLVSQPTFSGTKVTISSSYTPAGTISKPNITVTPKTTSVYSITNVGTLPSATLSEGTLPSATFDAGTAPSLSATYTESTKTVKIGFDAGTLPTHSFSAGTLPSLTFNAGTLPTKGSAQTVMTEVTAALASTPTFSGTEATISADYTPTGSVSKPTFSGTEVTISSSYTPAGSISQPTFTGSEVNTSTPEA